MGIWLELLNSILFALVFAFLVAKLIALVVSFKEQGSSTTAVADENENYFGGFTRDRIPAHENLQGEEDSFPEEENVRQIHVEKSRASVSEDKLLRVSPQSEELCNQDEKIEEESMPVKGKDEGKLEERLKEVASTKENVEFYDLDGALEKTADNVSEPAIGEVIEDAKEEDFAKELYPEEEKEFRLSDTSLLSDEDEWEGVESSELDETFGAAAAYIASMAANLSQKIPNETQIRLYGLYKVATEGPCNVPQPLPLKMGARAKWHAWQRLGNMTPDAAMEQYIGVLNEIFPRWSESLLEKKRKVPDSSQQSTNSGGMTSVFSSFVHQEGSDDEVKLEVVHSNASEGDTAGLLQLLDQGVPVDLRDSQGRTALQWAVDRGHLEIVELLVSKGADVNAKDMKGQTALHYALVCEREGIAKYLINLGADPYTKDNEGVTPYNLCPTNWYWLSQNA